MSEPDLSWFSENFAALVDGRELPPQAVERFMCAVMTEHCPELETAAFLTALRMKGETAREIAAAARILRKNMVPLNAGVDTLDTCGTGGDGADTFNISTAAALVAAGAGVPVVKHGNRSVSSRSGSADVLAAMGVRLENDPNRVGACLQEAGLAFCFAPAFHPAMRHVAPVRRRLKVRTLFNLLGPLANPAGAAYQLLGVGKAEWLDPLAGAAAELGARRVLLVCGYDGLDEVSLSSPTRVREASGGKVKAYDWQAADFGLEPCKLDDLKASGPEESAAIIREVLDGKEGPASRIVLANAAAALLAREHVTSLRDGVREAAEAVRTGKARAVLDRLVAWSTGS